MRNVAPIVFAVLWVTCLYNIVAQPGYNITLPQISAHRGASRIAPENTLASFRKAIEAGAHFIEIDVRTTADGEQVIVHDKSLKRTTGLNAAVNETNYNSLRKLSAGSWFGNSFNAEKVPTLEEVCQLVIMTNKSAEKSVMLYVDCKSIDARKVVHSLKKYELLDSSVFYGDVQTLKEIKNLFGDARVMPALPSRKETGKVIGAISPYAFDVPFERLDPETVSYIKSKDIKVFSDLLGENDRPDAYRKAIELGIDLIQTDDVEAVLKTYKEYEKERK